MSDIIENEEETGIDNTTPITPSDEEDVTIVEPSEDDGDIEPTEPSDEEDNGVSEDIPVASDEKARETPFIELFIETGECLSNANTYVSLEFARKYAIERGYEDILLMTDDELKKMLIRGTDYIDHVYKYRGTKCTKQQALAFPRKNLIDDDGFEIDGIPLNLKKAVVEAAKLVRTQDTLFITKNRDGKIKRKKVDVLETEFFDSRDDSLDYATIYEVLNSLLDGLYRTDSEKLTYNVGAVWIDD